MKSKITTLCLMALLFLFVTDAVAQCTSDRKYPSSNYNPVNSGAYETINTDCRPGQYALVTGISSNRVYTFASSVPTDYITITNIIDEVLVHGPSGLTWIPPVNTGSYIKYIITSNASCSEEGESRSRFFASQPLPNCGTPTALTVSNITSNSARLSWTAPATAPGSGYEAYVSTTMLTPVATTAATVTTATNAIDVVSGLNPATNYYYWVRSNCGQQKGVWTYGGGFRTIPFIGCNGAIYGLNPQATFTPACTGTAEVISQSRAGEYANVNILVDKQYTFASSVATDYITITNADGTIVYATGSTPVVWPSSAVSGVIRYYIHSNSSCGAQNTNRTRSVTCATMACGLPGNLAISNITSNSCRVNWSAPSVLPSGGYELYRSTASTAPVATTAATLTAPSNVISTMYGLTPATTYYYWVRSVCGTSKSEWVSGGSFTTNPLWGCNGGGGGLYPEQTFTPAGTGADEVIVTDAQTSQYTNINIVPNRQYTFSSSRFDFATVTNEAGDVVLANGATPLRWTSTAYSGVVRYYLHADPNCLGDSLLRTRSITSAPMSACPWPVGVRVSDITSSSAFISWIPNSNEPDVSYWVSISSSPFTAPNVQNGYSGGTRPNGKITNQLQANTVYYFFVSKSCNGGGSTPWVSGGTFKTLPTIYESCNGAFYGIFPLEPFTPACTGASEVITEQSLASQFSYVNVLPDKQYTFLMDNTSDYLTITNEAGTQLLVKGRSPLVWNSGSYTGVVRYYVHAHVACGSDSYYRRKSIKCVDNCVAPPSAATVSGVTATSATLWWPVSASSYQYYYSTSSTVPPDSYPTTSNITTTRPVVLTNLTPGATYYVWVRSVCANGNSAWVAGAGFTTFAGGCFTGTLYPNNSFTPSCNGGPETITTQAYAAEYSILNITPSSTYTLASSVTTDYVTVTNGDGTILYAYGPTPLTWSSGTNTGQIRFYLHTDINCGAESVNRTKTVTCVNPNTCGLPTNITVTNITSNSAQYNYTAPANAPTVGYQFLATLTNTAPSNSLAAVANTTNTYGAVSALLPNTTYYSWVRSVCITGSGLWVPGPSFTTIATATTGCNGAVNGVWPQETFTPACTGNNEVITANAYAGQFSNINIADNKLYTFTSSVTTDYITITNESGTITYAAGTTPLTWYSDTTSGVARYHLNSNASCAANTVDRTKSIKCVTPPPCEAVTNITVNNITSNSAKYNYTVPANAPSGGYQFQYTLTNAAPAAGLAAVANTTNAYGTVSGLLPGTTYYSWVRSICTTGAAAWVAGPSFTTIAAATTGCNGAVNGVWPQETFTPACSGNNEVIATNALTGQFSNINFADNKLYTFTSSVTTDYITITNENGTVTYAAGATPLTWYSGTTSGVARYYLHTNASCAVNDAVRTKSIKCSTPVCNAVTNVYVSNITSNSATFGWTLSASSGNTQYYVSTQNSAPTANTTLTDVTNSRVQLASLAPSTVYYYWVRTNCGSGVYSAWVAGSFTTGNALVCNGTTVTAGYSGLYPEQTFQPSCTGTAEVISASTWAGEYSNVAIVANKVYTFISAVATDYLTITSADGNTILASGTTPVTWSSGNTTGIIRFFLHTDNSCGAATVIRTRSIICAQPCTAPVTPAFTQVAPICAGSSLSALPVDSTNGIFGSWSPALNNQVTTTYTFTPAAGQCATTATMTIVVRPANTVPTFTQVAPICAGSYLAELPVDSNNGINGSWSPAINNMATTTYTFTPSPGQCAVPTTMTIATTLPPNRVPTFTQVAAICAGSSLSALPVYSNEQIQGTWSPALNNQATTTYTFTPAAGQCATTATMTITVTNANIVPTFTQVGAVCRGSNISQLPVDSNNGINGSWSPALNNQTTTTYTFTPSPGQCAVTTTMTITVTNANIVPAFTQVAPICAGSYLAELPVDSNNGINGSWSPAINNMATTTYTFTPAAGQCATTATMTITVTNANIVPTFTQVAPICAGSYLAELPVDSNNGINGSWSPAINNMATTTYTFTPSPGQCAVPTTMTISTTLPPNRVPTFTQVAPVCAGEFMNALPLYSNEQIQGTWSPALNNQVTTTYTFTPAAGQCATTAMMTIAVNTIPQAPSNVNSCGTYILPALPNGYFYTGTNNEGTPLAQGTPIYYSQTVYIFYDNVPCSTQASFEVTIQPIFNDTVVNGGTITALMAGTGVTYEWYRCLNGQSALITGANGQSYVPTENGYYQVKITVPGCGSVYSDCVLIDNLGTGNTTFSGVLKIYPNPTPGQFTVDTGVVETEKITVIDNLGRTIKTVYPSSTQTQLDIAECADGVYFIKIENRGQVAVKKLMKQ